MREWALVPGLVPPLEVLGREISHRSLMESKKVRQTWSLDMDWFRIRSIRESVYLVRSSLESLTMCQGNYYGDDHGETRRQGLELFKLLLDRFFVVESHIVGEHVADFLRGMFNCQ
jgi:hypothetical protein